MGRPVADRAGEYSKDVITLTNLKRAIHRDSKVTKEWREKASSKLNDLLIILLHPETD